MKQHNIFEDMFSEKELQSRRALWQVLCADFFQRYIASGDTVLDLGAGFCEFINTIHCKKKIAVDCNNHTARHAGPDVQCFSVDSCALSGVVAPNTVDAVFMSNFLEHLPDVDALTATLAEAKKILKPGGKLLILQPNIRYAYKVYWDFIDHRLPLSHKSLSEAVMHAGFDIVELKPKFLPWSTKSHLPQHPLLVKLYLKCPPAQYIMGKQLFLYARKPANEPSPEAG